MVTQRNAKPPTSREVRATPPHSQRVFMQQHHDDAPKSDSRGGHCRTQEYASSMVSEIDRRKGLSATAAAEVFWGLTPIYWKAVATAPAGAGGGG